MKEGQIYDWIFHYNHYTQKWNACKRDYYNELFSNSKSANILKSSSISTLVELISKTEGKASNIKKFLKDQVKHVIAH